VARAWARGYFQVKVTEPNRTWARANATVTVTGVTDSNAAGPGSAVSRGPVRLTGGRSAGGLLGPSLAATRTWLRRSWSPRPWPLTTNLKNNMQAGWTEAADNSFRAGLEALT
jgi:hypothetical protein